MFRLALLSFLLATSALGNTIQTWRGRPVSAVTASADYTSAAIDTSVATSASVHCFWASLTGTLDGQFAVEVSNNTTSGYAPKSGATITVSGATGDEMISLNGVVTEDNYRITWAHNNVSGGTVNCYAVFKG